MPRPRVQAKETVHYKSIRPGKDFQWVAFDQLNKGNFQRFCNPPVLQVEQTTKIIMLIVASDFPALGFTRFAQTSSTKISGAD